MTTLESNCSSCTFSSSRRGRSFFLRLFFSFRSCRKHQISPRTHCCVRNPSYILDERFESPSPFKNLAAPYSFKLIFFEGSVSDVTTSKLLDVILEVFLVDLVPLFTKEQKRALIDSLFLDPDLFSPLLSFQSLCKALNYKR
jgi:hypothetical protein